MEKQLLLLLLPWLLLTASRGVKALRFTIDDFPDGFAFGAGTAAFQYEGVFADDGKSQSIWDTFAHSARNPNERSGDLASDGYHKYKEDVRLIKEIGLKAYRFSISWTRLIPNGRGALNPKGLQFYNNMINELVKEDLPQILEDEYGGWLSPRIVILHPFLFGDYPESMRKAAGSRLPSFSNYESKLVTDAFDFIGLNHYSSVYASNNPDMSKMPVRDQAADMGALFRETRNGPTSMQQYLPGRMIDPQGLEYVLKYLQRKYGNISIYIQENGYPTSRIVEGLSFIRNGANVKGYSVWSFIDLYEMFGGYKAHFGLVQVDFRDKRRQRQPRLSAYWFSDFLKNGAVIEVDDYAAAASLQVPVRNFERQSNSLYSKASLKRL
ncbi:hypothetical protein PR202_ga04437 [Eleusine coracana subsp. coracana]|uniref:Beta-glucosidase n=1 Tax=Eleusine coracana subsp. coracana TaxID=191504 RepID=A0AAV5BPX3_ELECO|nr:hypothetical protein PR202_ga04437 [Eleusine coracana subsp. coracana]